ncbi:hypothetical protein CF54_02355 [Streptomyces sp. Tu 6176]|uniref:hypothetical protein n=1 Tax=Streptomyces sp. Tu 6176 TaxID=1470557 RepID=UPI00044EAEE6|nr:hypothetical protein [Streptomyces sp. Tu 6176]EYT84280.1 hypothetical protein CF54_02355 [Streptomyces sp. Tu 6176]
MYSGTSPSPARPPVEARLGVLVHPAADRRLATEHWLLSTHRDPRAARLAWREHGAALLPLGTLFSAVRIPAALVQVLAGSSALPEVDAFLAEALHGDPVICDPRFGTYYALVPASMPATWRETVDGWRSDDVECLGRGTYLGVPKLSMTTFDGYAASSYWSVPMASPAELCAPLTVARLIASAAHLLADADVTLAAQADEPPAPEGA